MRPLHTMRKRLEQHLQRDIIIWANLHRPDIVVIPVVNEAAYNNRQQVVLKGVSDLIVVLPEKTIFVELKQPNSVQSKFQKMFQERVEKLNKEYYIIRSLDEFKRCIEPTQNIHQPERKGV